MYQRVIFGTRRQEDADQTVLRIIISRICSSNENNNIVCKPDVHYDTGCCKVGPVFHGHEDFSKNVGKRLL